jgi:hypothetical protein
VGVIASPFYPRRGVLLPILHGACLAVTQCRRVEFEKDDLAEIEQTPDYR